MTVLAKQISARMKAKNISTIELEREAGLKAHAVRNILRGHSKRPAVDIVQAIARVLDCTIEDLLQGYDIFTEDENEATKEEVLNQPYKPGLLMETVKLVDSKVTKGKHRLTNKQVLICIEEIYLHSLQKGTQKVDQDFAEWFMEMVG